MQYGVNHSNYMATDDPLVVLSESRPFFSDQIVNLVLEIIPRKLSPSSEIKLPCFLKSLQALDHCGEHISELRDFRQAFVHLDH